MASAIPAPQPTDSPDGHTIFAMLRDALADLYTTQEDANLLVHDVWLVTREIAFSARAQTNWHHILTAAIHQARLEALLDLARNDYLDNEALHVAYTHYRQLIERGEQLSAPLQPAEGSINTNGGMYVVGNITTSSGDVIGGDQHIHGDQIRGDKIGIQVNYWQLAPPPLAAADLAAANALLAQLPTEVIPPIATLPPGSRMPFSANPLFVGREADLLRLATALKGGETVAVGQIAAATGLGGIGKTQLAVAFVHHYGRFFAGGVYWLSFADAGAVMTEIAACGATMPELRADLATLELEAQVRLVLAAWQNGLPRLLVFDNCEDQALLAQWRPRTGGSRVLITSRRQGWDEALGVQILALATLDRVQSIELLRKFRPDLAANDTHLDQIAAELGDLPLALHLAGSYLARYRYDVLPAKYLTQLRQPDPLRHRSLQAGNLSPTKHVQHVQRTFALSYERLDPANELDAQALDLLARSAWFAPGQLIPRALLLATVEPEAAGEATLQAADALATLTNLGLLEMNAAGDLLLHRLLAHFVRQSDPMRSEAVQSVVAATLHSAASQINDARLPGPLLIWQNHLRHVTDTLQHQASEQAAALCNTLGFHLNMVGEYATAKPYYERALAIREAVLGSHHPDTATSLNNLGWLLNAMGESAAAKPYYERALTIREAVLGSQHPDTTSSLNNLGRLLNAMGEPTAAKPYYERALAIREAVLGPQHPATARSLNNLGWLLNAMGEPAAAKPYYERALAIREAVLGSHHPDTASTLNNLGRLLQDMGEPTAAKPYYERALAINEAVLGPQHPATATSYNNLGTLLNTMGEPAAAKPYLERALAIREAVLGPQHPDTATSYNNLGALLKDIGEPAAAKPYYERALSINEAVLGLQHPATALSYNNLGTLLKEIGEPAAAKMYLERALIIFEQRLGQSHPSTQIVRDNLAALS